MEGLNDKLSIKNLLFTKAIPNYEIPVPITGHKVYACTDCGDKFIFESSYEDHINRKSMQITYMCRHCGTTQTFMNRCKLLCHIRSHAFKTATINVQDLKVEPIPLAVYATKTNQVSKSNEQAENSKKTPISTFCFECKQHVPIVGMSYKNRASHFMQYTNEVHSCPVCLFTLPTVCGLRTHMRFHLKCPPYYCPECGINIPHKSVHYPFNHDCEGFKMMRATARLKCPVADCHLFHPNDFKDHMRENHLKKVFKCPICVVACFNESTMIKHLKTHNSDNNAMIFYQCQMCPGRLVLQNHMDNHLRTHVHANVFPCWTCGTVFKEVFALIDHHIKKHTSGSNAVTNMLTSIVNESENQCGKKKRVYRVVKRCDQCKRNFTYKCKYNEIPVLPSECPYKCTPKLKSNATSDKTQNQITCHMCKTKIADDWKEIKKHFASIHKNHRCLDPKLVLNKIDINKYLTQNKRKIAKRRRPVDRRLTTKPKENEKDPLQTTTPIVPVNGAECVMCGHVCENQQILQTHMISHRDPCMAYQCMECGQSFVVKPSFSKHLLLEHGITDAEEYINSKQCYNENALETSQNTNELLEPIKDNQCTICRDQFDNAEELEKHFRVHGMAFLLKNTAKSS